MIKVGSTVLLIASGQLRVGVVVDSVEGGHRLTSARFPVWIVQLQSGATLERKTRELVENPS